MDSQLNTPEQGLNEEEKVLTDSTIADENAKETESPSEKPLDAEQPTVNRDTENGSSQQVYNTKQEVLDRIREIAHGEEAPRKEEVDYLKTAFYKLHIAEREAQQREYLEAGGNPDTYTMLPDDMEEAFKAEMIIIKEKRAKLFQEKEAEKAENLKRKLDIIEKIKAMVTSPDEANKSYPQFKELQQEWKEIKAVPAEKANELWRNYQSMWSSFTIC